jgi:hypothetical protein
MNAISRTALMANLMRSERSICSSGGMSQSNYARNPSAHEKAGEF